MAEFREAMCEMTVRKALASHTGKKRKRRRIDIGDEGSQESPSQDNDTQENSAIEEDIYSTLASEDQRLIDAFLDGFVPPVRKGSTTVMDQADIIEKARDIIKGAIDIVLFGGLKRVNGIKVLEGSAAQGLTQLLPGVFHIPHLKVSSVFN